MRQAVLPGKTIDIVTPAELQQLLASELRETPQRSITASAAERQDASGAVELLEIYKVPAGMEFELGWITIETDGSTFVAPVYRAGSGAQLEVDGVARDFYFTEDPDSAVVGFGLLTPFRKAYSSGGTVRCQNGSILSLKYRGGSGGIITATIGGRLYARPTGE